MAAGNYTRNQWFDAKTGVKVAPAINPSATKTTAFTPPDTTTDWILLVRE